MLFSQIRQYVKGVLANSFINKSTLDKLGENNNGLTFDGNNIKPPQKLTAAQMQAIKAAFVIDAPRNGYPVLFDETGAEHFVGWYKYANGTKKPVYESYVSISSMPNNTELTYPHNISNIDKILDYLVIMQYSDGSVNKIPYVADNPYSAGAYVTKTNILIKTYTDRSSASGIVTIRYTKTTDTPQ